MTFIPRVTLVVSLFPYSHSHSKCTLKFVVRAMGLT